MGQGGVRVTFGNSNLVGSSLGALRIKIEGLKLQTQSRVIEESVHVAAEV